MGNLSEKKNFKGGRNMVSDFLGTAFPWILIALFVASSCSLMSKNGK